MAATITVAADADTTLDLARRFLHAVNTKNADALIETVSEDIVYELHTPRRPSRYEDMTPFGRRWPHSSPPGRTTTSRSTPSTSTPTCSPPNGP